MKVAVSLDHRFVADQSGAVFTKTMFDYLFWQRYRTVFDEIFVLARVKRVASIESDVLRADGPGVTFIPLPYYKGPIEYLKNQRETRRMVRAGLQKADAVIMRVPSHVGNLVYEEVRRSGRSFGVEVVGDPYDSFSPGASNHPFRFYFRAHFSRLLRRQCRDAVCASYVTKTALQKRYPAAPDAFITHYSSILLTPEWFAPEPKAFSSKRPMRLVTVCSLAHLQKGSDLLIRVLSIDTSALRECQLTIIGDGGQRQKLEALAQTLQVQDRVTFAGQLTHGEAIRERLDAADVFVLPSRQEGLPRAMIEAMARGLPCVGSDVGGIPELLSRMEIARCGDIESLTSVLDRLLSNPARLTEAARENFDRAGEFRDFVLGERRNRFYYELEHRTPRA